MFENKVVAITGAGSGIGRSLAVNLARRGAILALSDINEATLNETVALLPPAAKAKCYTVDVASESSVYSFADDVEKDFGATHFIINNAGTSLIGSVANVSTEEVKRVIDINMWGVFYGTKAFMRGMLERNEGVIINISSVFGLLGTPCSVAYTMSKFAVRGLTETLWFELASTNVRAVCVHPGGINTNIDSNSPFAKNAGDFENNVSEAHLKNMITSPDDCAEEIVAGLSGGGNRLLVGNGAKALSWISRIFPNSYLNIIGKKVGL